jgi:lycopene beta-cyclase
MNDFDYIIAGGGASGLSLAFYLSNSSLKNKKVLIIDKDQKNKNDRTWGFWTSRPTAFESIISYRYKKIEFISKFTNLTIPLGDYSYNVIQGIDFYQFIKSHLSAFPNFRFINEAITQINDLEDGAEVITNLGKYTAGWVFSSLYDEKEIVKAAASKLYLRQHFKGWVIETPKQVFDPESLRIFDFRTPQENQMRFFYVIPHSKNRALVEFTIFSENLLEKPQYENALKRYISEFLKLDDYQIVEEEFGVIPMTNYRFPAKQGKHIVNIGSLGGSSKPSSGYTFFRIQKHVQKIVEALEKGKAPVISANSPIKYHLYDSVLLNILKNNGSLSERIFSEMFKNNTIRQIFRFLDETGGLKNDLKIITSLSPMPFLKSTVSLLTRKIFS